MLINKLCLAVLSLVVLALASGCGSMSVKNADPVIPTTGISGTITNTSSDPIPTAYISILTPGYETTVRSDSSGRYSIPLSSTSILYNVAASKEGYYAGLYSNVSITAGNMTVQNFKLTSSLEPAGTLNIYAKNISSVPVSSTFIITKEGDSYPVTVSVTSNTGYGTIFGLVPSKYLIYVSKYDMTYGLISCSTSAEVLAHTVVTAEAILR